MKHLLNTLYILSEDIYLSLDGENVVANRDKQAVARYPLHTLQNMITFSYAGASPALMGPVPSVRLGWHSAPLEEDSWPGCAERETEMSCSAGRSTVPRTTPGNAAKSAAP